MSKKFEFGLEKLLQIRVDREENSKRLYKKSQGEMEATKEKLSELNESYDRYNGINKGETLAYQKIKKNYLFALSKGIEETEKELERRMQEVEFRRQDLKKKQIERKTVDILKEKKKREFQEEEARIEQIQNDEFALYAYIRNAGEEVKE